MIPRDNPLLKGMFDIREGPADSHAHPDTGDIVDAEIIDDGLSSRATGAGAARRPHCGALLDIAYRRQHGGRSAQAPSWPARSQSTWAQAEFCAEGFLTGSCRVLFSSSLDSRLPHWRLWLRAACLGLLSLIAAGLSLLAVRSSGP